MRTRLATGARCGGIRAHRCRRAAGCVALHLVELRGQFRGPARSGPAGVARATLAHGRRRPWIHPAPRGSPGSLQAQRRI